MKTRTELVGRGARVSQDETVAVAAQRPVSEAAVRALAKRLGLKLEKSRCRCQEAADCGTYRVVDPKLNAVACKGAAGQYGLTLEQANAFIQEVA